MRYNYAPSELKHEWIEEAGWKIEVIYWTKCIRKGTYSPIAEDPEEYYGLYVYGFEDVGTVYDDNGIEREDEDIPDWVYEEAEAYVDSMR